MVSLPLSFVLQFLLGYTFYVLYDMVPLPGRWDSTCAVLGAHCLLPWAMNPSPSGGRGTPYPRAPTPDGVGRAGMQDLRPIPATHSSLLCAHVHLLLWWFLMVLSIFANIPSFLFFISFRFFLLYPSLPHPSPSAVCLRSDRFGGFNVRVPPVGANG